MSLISHSAPEGVSVRKLSKAEEEVVDQIATLTEKITGTEPERIVAIVSVGTYFTPPYLSQYAPPQIRRNGVEIP